MTTQPPPAPASIDLGLALANGPLGSDSFGRSLAVVAIARDCHLAESPEALAELAAIALLHVGHLGASPSEALANAYAKLEAQVSQGASVIGITHAVPPVFRPSSCVSTTQQEPDGEPE